MRVLGIETSCDETAVALVETNPWSTDILSQVISSQIELHRPYGGVVPEVATREHLRNLPVLVPQVLRDLNLTLDSIDAVAATEGPGLASSLLIGHSYARAMAVALSKPMIGVNHLEGHLYSPFFSSKRAVEFPFVALIASGGHTLLVHALGWDRYIKLGSTVDDAAGEAFDKVAKLLGLPYPGGPEIERVAIKGNPEAFGLPRSFPERDNLNFSFSGPEDGGPLFLREERADADRRGLVVRSLRVVPKGGRRCAGAEIGAGRGAGAGGAAGGLGRRALQQDAARRAGVRLLRGGDRSHRGGAGVLHGQRGDDRRDGGGEIAGGHRAPLRRRHQPEPKSLFPRATRGGGPRPERGDQAQKPADQAGWSAGRRSGAG